MSFINSNNKIILDKNSDFDISQILECGQCFRFSKISEGHYSLIAFSRLLHVRQTMDSIEFYPCSLEEFETVWRRYFDLDRDYGAVKKLIIQNDTPLEQAVAFAPGIRILRQDPWETLISFIISQNNRIPQIMNVVQNLSAKYGAEINGVYAFPTVDDLKKADLEGVFSCKAGFRAKYILDAVEKVSNGLLGYSCEPFIDSDIETGVLKKQLLTICGVGEKVADCVLLYGFGRTECFPTDVWVKRVMQHFYFNGNQTPLTDIQQLASDKYGQNAGFAQQYLFNYARTLEIFKKTRKKQH